jgi:hypothetical protein
MKIEFQEKDQKKSFDSNSNWSSFDSTLKLDKLETFGLKTDVEGFLS